jgi:hypothetical protein
MTHQFVNSNLNVFDSNCAVCDGKQRDSVHALAACLYKAGDHTLANWQTCGRMQTGAVCPCIMCDNGSGTDFHKGPFTAELSTLSIGPFFLARSNTSNPLGFMTAHVGGEA